MMSDAREIFNRSSLTRHHDFSYFMLSKGFTWKKKVQVARFETVSPVLESGMCVLAKVIKVMQSGHVHKMLQCYLGDNYIIIILWLWLSYHDIMVIQRQSRTESLKGFENPISKNSTNVQLTACVPSLEWKRLAASRFALLCMEPETWTRDFCPMRPVQHAKVNS